MKTLGTLLGFTTIVEHFRNVIAVLGVLTFPRRLAPVPVPVRRRSALGTIRRINPSRRTGWFSLMAAIVLLAAMPAWAGQRALPSGVPDMSDPEVRARFVEVGIGNLRGNPDFPVILLLNTAGDQPKAFLFVVDARNGKNTWSLATDPIILIVLFSDQTTIQAVYADSGFVDVGKASGTYAAVDKRNAAALPDLLKALTEAATRTYI